VAGITSTSQERARALAVDAAATVERELVEHEPSRRDRMRGEAVA
jgi:hypothetical protein